MRTDVDDRSTTPAKDKNIQHLLKMQASTIETRVESLPPTDWGFSWNKQDRADSSPN
jgi:hypothetical protein